MERLAKIYIEEKNGKTYLCYKKNKLNTKILKELNELDKVLYYRTLQILLKENKK